MKTLHYLALAAAAMAAALPAAATDPVALSHNDPAIGWGPCPPFFSAGCRIGVLHGDPAGNNADVFFRLEPGDTIPPHTHTSAERMVLVQGTLEVQYVGFEKITLTPGMYAYGPPQAEHDGACLGAERCVLFIAFEQPVDALPVE